MERDPIFWKHYRESYEELIEPLEKIDLAELNVHNPVFDAGFCKGPLHPDESEWFRYQKTYQLLAELKQQAGRPLKILDYGMLFGIPTLTFQKAGNELYAVDDFGFYGPSFEPLRDRLKEQITIRGVDTLYEIPYEDDFFDVVNLLAVIEHIPDSPSKLLSEIRRVLVPGGLLIVDTPNVASAYKRLVFFFKGSGVFPELPPYFESEIPFTGHHREYNRQDLTNVLTWSGFDVERFEIFEQRESTARGLFGLAQRIAMALFEDWRPYLWCTARKPISQGG